MIKALAPWILLAPFLTACHIGYIVENAYHQGRLLKRAVPVEDVLESSEVNDTVKAKLRLAEDAKQFAEKTLKLKKTKNYTTYVQLDGPYVTYIVSAAPRDELAYYTWYFPIVGSVPYKGYFVKDKADRQAKELKDEGYDVYVRGVSAFSTLGWFKDPILSSMTRYSDYDLVNTIIHETVHSTLYISSNANFNERLATYLGDLGAKLYYEQKTQKAAEVLKNVQSETEDQRKFGEFISLEIKKLGDWYKAHKGDPQLLTDREKEFQRIKAEFKTRLAPELKTDKYASFAEAELNNAKLMGLKLYMNDLSDFEKLAQKMNFDYQKILDYCKSLENEKDPEGSLKKFVSSPL